MLGVDAEVAHAAIRAVGLQLPFPVDGLAQVHIRRVLDGEACLDHAAEEALLIPAEELLRGGVIRKFARAADKDLRMLPHGAQDLLAGGQIDPERLFGQQMLAGTDDIGIDLRVLVMRHGAVNGFDLRIFQKLVIIMVKIPRIWHAPEPVEAFVRPAARGDDLWARQVGLQMQPAHGGACKLPAHQPAADDAEFDGLLHAQPSISDRHCSIHAISFPTIGSVTSSGSFVSATGRQLAL